MVLNSSWIAARALVQPRYVPLVGGDGHQAYQRLHDVISGTLTSLILVEPRVRVSEPPVNAY